MNATRAALATFLALAIASTATAAQAGGASVATLDSIAGAGIRANRAAGLVAAVVKGNDTILLRAYGKADVEWNVPMTTDAMFEVGSITKQFTAAAILQLRDAGKLSLDDPVSKWVSNLGATADRVTLRHLLNHTSGINHFTDVPDFEINYFVPRFPRDSALRFITLEPVQFPMGQAQAYNNSAFWLLALIVERASGMSFEQYVATKIFEPLGMTRSMYCNSAANVERRAHGYQVVPGIVRRAPMMNYTWVFGPGAICSTAGDLVKWMQALHGGKVLSPQSYAEMITPAKLADGTTLQYGLGIKVGEDMRGLKFIGHGGTVPGFRSDAMWYPESGLAVVVLINSSPAALAAGAVGSDLAHAALPWKRTDLRYYTDDASALVGTYRHVVGGNQAPFTIDVSATPEGLAFSFNGSRPERLPWAGGLRFYANETVTLTFARSSADGPITELRRDDAGNHYIMRKQ